MRAIFSQRPLRFVFAANLISMVGSGMNSAAVAWYILKATHSEVALGTFAVLQTVPAMLMLPFTGVVIDREDRRRLVMWLDAVRALIIVAVAILAFRHQVQVWQLYLMNTLVAAGFWMFWPTITALIQELTPEGEFVQSNTFLLAGVQGGFLIAGAIVGFIYDHIGLGGVLTLDVSTYVVSFLCYFAVRKGKHVVIRTDELRADIVAAETQLQRFGARCGKGCTFFGTIAPSCCWESAGAFFLGAMVTGVVVTPSLSDRVFHAGAKGIWVAQRGLGHRGFRERDLCALGDRALGGRRAVAFSMALLSSLCRHCSDFRIPVPCDRDIFRHGFCPRCGRSRDEHEPDGMVPKHLMGRVQNAFYFAERFCRLVLAVCVGTVAQKVSLVVAFAILRLRLRSIFRSRKLAGGGGNSGRSHG